MKKVAQARAEAALAVVVKRYAQWFEEGFGKPTLVERDTHWEIIWEEGPYEWALLATAGGLNEEFFHGMYPEFIQDREKALAAATTEPLKFPATVFVEPQTTYSLAVHPR